MHATIFNLVHYLLIIFLKFWFYYNHVPFIHSWYCYGYSAIILTDVRMLTRLQDIAYIVEVAWLAQSGLCSRLTCSIHAGLIEDWKCMLDCGNLVGAQLCSSISSHLTLLTMHTLQCLTIKLQSCHMHRCLVCVNKNNVCIIKLINYIIGMYSVIVMQAYYL